MKASDIILWLCHKLLGHERAAGQQQTIRIFGGILPLTEKELDSHQMEKKNTRHGQ